MVVIDQFSFGCNPGVVFILPGIALGQQSIDTRICDTVDNAESEQKLTIGMTGVVIDKACKLDCLALKFIWIVVDSLHDFHIVFISDLNTILG
ncbi:Uncharacterised protein [Streptococcus pneumoniae]|nr:Uncharacterised protein [Streptococcus pneumoniae]CAG6086139.1 Uncharacterised protein [Streptococcus pneumoniae]